MKKQYYPLLYRLNNKNRYLIWEITDGSEDTFFIDSKRDKVPIFSKLKSFKKYAEKNNIKIIDYSKPLLHDLDSVLIWLNNNSRSDIECEDILTAWNFFIDMANSFDLDNKELQAYRSNAPKAYKIYTKVFYGNNLANITPDDKLYMPKWKKKELKLIRKVLLYGFTEFKQRKIKIK